MLLLKLGKFRASEYNIYGVIENKSESGDSNVLLTFLMEETLQHFFVRVRLTYRAAVTKRRHLIISLSAVTQKYGVPATRNVDCCSSGALFRKITSYNRHPEYP